jgi:hypothetical protein
MTRLVLKSWLALLYFDCILHFRGFPRIHEIVRKQQVTSSRSASVVSVRDVCHAIDLACVFYFKRVFCLQRSALATILLRRNGWSAEMVIGAQVHPPKSHAWVEVRSVVVNDKPYMRDMYQELERC